ncbi:YigZ family protein [Treponema sp.]|uniref:YigZ family protein n=1 Tax=Treponema sp. TaxID=166 RepID=UPI00388DE290
MKVLLNNPVNEINIKGSRFIAEVFTVTTQAEAREKLHEQKLRYSDATHVCHCFISGLKAEACGMSDDGEPSGTAGRPMLDVLKGSGITNILVTVTRYFGGTLLGTGGLVKAYGDSVKEVLSLCETEEYIERTDFSFECDWGIYETIKRKIEIFHISDLTESFDTGVKLSGRIYSSEIEELKEMIKNISKGKITCI